MTEKQFKTETVGAESLKLCGPELQVGQQAPDFTAVSDLFEPVRLGAYKGKVLVVSALMSVDTPVCETIIRRFDREAKLFRTTATNAEIWSITVDLPFTLKRFRESANVMHIKTLSDFRDRRFGQDYGVLITDGVFTEITARAVFVIGKNGRLEYAEYLTDLTSEPRYADIINRAAIAQKQ